MAYKNIVIATDFSNCSLVALETALQLAAGSDTALHLLHVVEMASAGVDPMISVSSAYDSLEQAARQQMEKLIPENLPPGVTLIPVVTTGQAVSTIADYATEKEADLIVVGTHGREGLTRLLVGSTAEALLRRAPCQVLVAKAKKQVPAHTE